MFDVTVEELGHAVLIKSFRLVGAALGEFVTAVLQNVFQEQWREKAGEDLTKKTLLKLRLKSTRGQALPLKDVYLVTELILLNLEVFQKEVRRGAKESEEGFRLERMATDVDCVNCTRTWLFHGVDVSLNEAGRCLLCLENTWRCFAQLEEATPSVIDGLKALREVRL